MSPIEAVGGGQFAHLCFKPSILIMVAALRHSKIVNFEVELNKKFCFHIRTWIQRVSFYSGNSLHKNSSGNGVSILLLLSCTVIKFVQVS